MPNATPSGLRLLRDGAVATIVFDRADTANAIQPDWPAAIAAFVAACAVDPAIRALVIRGEGRHFQAGGDLSDALDGDPDALLDRARRRMADWNRALIAIHELAKPVVVAVQGGTVGASVALVAACDLVVAADDAFFIVAQAKIGASLDGLPSWFLPRRIGFARAMEWTLLAERIDAVTARGAGLVNRVVPRDTLAAEAHALAQRLAEGPTVALGISKRLLQASGGNDARTQGDLEADLYGRVIHSRDWHEGIRAFLEKRDPLFIGR